MAWWVPRARRPASPAVQWVRATGPATDGCAGRRAPCSSASTPDGLTPFPAPWAAYPKPRAESTGPACLLLAPVPSLCPSATSHCVEDTPASAILYLLSWPRRLLAHSPQQGALGCTLTRPIPLPRLRPLLSINCPLPPGLGASLPRSPLYPNPAGPGNHIENEPV